MHHLTVSTKDFLASTRWSASFFLEETPLSSSFALRPLRTVVVESKTAIDPKVYGADLINYIGLENIRPQTGELINFRPRPAAEVKSRSKVFKENDVLFGRLRPELNKAYLANGSVASGICSNEFIVLTARSGMMLPRYLRHLLSSPFVMNKCEKLRMGAALPRMNASDLLDIEVPVPPLEIQGEWVKTLEAIDRQIESYRRKVEELPKSLADELLRAVADGDAHLRVHLT